MFLQGVDIQQNVKNEIRVNGKSLVLRSVKKESMGNYSCVASNVEGDKKSNSVELRVSCKYYYLRVRIAYKYSFAQGILLANRIFGPLLIFGTNPSTTSP